MSKSLDLRLIEADYVMTRLPNANNNFQGDARLSAGLVFRFGVSAPAKAK